jgi:hypothetical protein
MSTGNGVHRPPGPAPAPADLAALVEAVRALTAAVLRHAELGEALAAAVVELRAAVLLAAASLDKETRRPGDKG